MLVVNADQVFARTRWYKIFYALRWSLFRDCWASGLLVLACLTAHSYVPDAHAPGVVLWLWSGLVCERSAHDARSDMWDMGWW